MNSHNTDLTAKTIADVFFVTELRGVDELPRPTP
jgi:hypothetical protein